MGMRVPQEGYSIDRDTRSTIATRYKTVTKAVNKSLWLSDSDTAHSFYVGSFGRGTAIDTSDIDILIEVPPSFYVTNTVSSYNPQSRLIQVVKEAILNSYPCSDVRGDGQVVVISFSDGMLFEVLPAILQSDWYGNITYKYPDSHMGGRWLSTNPKAEQRAMKERNDLSNGLLIDTCQHMRYVRDNYYSSYKLSGIVIDSFVYAAIGSWRWLNSGESSSASWGDYEDSLLSYYNRESLNGALSFTLKAPGSRDSVSTSKSLECLGKVLRKMAE